VLRVVGAGLLFATAGIHLDLYLTGYRSIPTIGILFLAQVVSAIALGAAVLARGDLLVAASGSVFCASTIGGYVLSRSLGLFGFKEVATTAGLVAGLIEVAGLVALGVFAIDQLGSTSGVPAPIRGLVARMPARPVAGTLGAISLAALTLTLLEGISHSSSSTSSSAKPAGHTITITITNFAFVPAVVAVSPGEQIRVVNKDAVAHTLTAVPGSHPFGRFDTGDIGLGQSVTLAAPTTAGSYSYYCTIHTFMTGVITVT
jgi:plastocyanin